MSDTTDRKKRLQPMLERLRRLQKEGATATEQLASDQGIMKAYEQERDRNYARCRELGIEPDDLRAEIDRRMSEMEAALTRLEARFRSLSGVDGGDDADAR